MSVRVTPKAEVVRQCVARQGGGFLIVTKKSSAGSPVAIPEGARVVLKDGVAERVP